MLIHVMDESIWILMRLSAWLFDRTGKILASSNDERINELERRMSEQESIHKMQLGRTFFTGIIIGAAFVGVLVMAAKQSS